MWTATSGCDGAATALRAAPNRRSRLHVRVFSVMFVLPQASTCADVSPVNKPGVKFACPEDTEFNPAMAEAMQPRAKSCCKVCRVRSVSDMPSTCCKQH